MKKKVFLRLRLTGKWGLNEKHLQTLINKGKNIKSFLQIFIDF